MRGEIIFNNFIGILFGPIDLPALNKSIRADISYEAAGDTKKNVDYFYRDSPK